MAELGTKFVPGDGPDDSHVMIIGEAPGENEEREGRPFIGRSGKLLNQSLANAGLPREQVYITNVVPYRPEGNATPTEEQIEEFALQHLASEVKKIEPKFVLLLGNTALGAVTNYVGGITRHRGWVPSIYHAFKPEVEVYATFHPAAALYNPINKAFFVQDIELFATRAKEYKREYSTDLVRG